MLKADNLVLGYGQKPVVQAKSLQFAPGKVYGLIGPNGSGKSTLLKGLAGFLKPCSGQVMLNGQVLSSWPLKSLARHMSLLPQTPVAPEGLTLLQLVRHGRFPHQSLLRSASQRDHEMVSWALQVTDLFDLRHRDINTLSGGERQRAWIALALAQQPQWLLLDEPTTYLDIGHQLEILQLLRQLNAAHGITVIMVLHDINQASQFSDHLLAMQQGVIVAEGDASQVISPSLLRELFNLDVEIITRSNVSGKTYPFCLPVDRLETISAVR